MSGKIFVISGPSGSGKTTLLEKLLKERGLKGKFTKSVSLTTRGRRAGEREKKDYFFTGEKEFLRLRKAKKILEWTKYLSYYYATPKEFIDAQLKKGISVGLCLDIKGARALKRIYPKIAVTIFILPPSIEALKKRIAKRCCETKEAEIRARVKIARAELKEAAGYGYRILNRNLNFAVKELKEIVLKEIDFK